VRVGRETAGRRGKGVTTITGLPLDHDQLLELATKLKNRCGTGGSVPFHPNGRSGSVRPESMTSWAARRSFPVGRLPFFLDIGKAVG
jgi:hypothetical protein